MAGYTGASIHNIHFSDSLFLEKTAIILRITSYFIWANCDLTQLKS
jgi:hypothetical protein